MAKKNRMRRRAYLAGVAGVLMAGCVTAGSDDSAHTTSNTTCADTSDHEASTVPEDEVTAQGGEMSTPPQNVEIADSKLVQGGKHGPTVKGHAKNTGNHPVSFRVVTSFMGNDHLLSQGSQTFHEIKSGATVEFELQPDDEYRTRITIECRKKITAYSIRVYPYNRPDASSEEET